MRWIIGAVALILATNAQAQVPIGSLSFSGTGTGSGVEGEYNYITSTGTSVVVDNGTANVAFNLNFYGDIGFNTYGIDGTGSEVLTSPTASIDNEVYGSNFWWGSDQAYFTGSRRSGNATLYHYTPANNGGFSEYFNYELGTNGLYTITGGGSYYYQLGSIGERTYDSSWTLHDIAISFDHAPIVPEPAAWAMMVGGFGVAGGALRRKRVRVSFN